MNMTWFLENWFWMVVVVAFIAMHLVGHAGQGVAPVPRGGPQGKDEGTGRRDETGPGGHQH
ncbi:hypothetical protein [Deinococcus sp. UYEF24]